MKRILTWLLVLALTFSGSCALADDYDLKNMTAAELNALIDTIKSELNENHTASGSYTSTADSVIKEYVENYYGKKNVDWAWIDYAYTRDWDFVTVTTHADIVKEDGGQARYDVYGELFPSAGAFAAVYVRIGTEVILDLREESIADNRIRVMLGLSAK